LIRFDLAGSSLSGCDFGLIERSASRKAAKERPPRFIFAPNPAETVGENICYIRPLATIEPTAIVCGLPVNTQFGYRDIQGLHNMQEFKN